jgi:hypothetical protein
VTPYCYAACRCGCLLRCLVLLTSHRCRAGRPRDQPPGPYTRRGSPTASCGGEGPGGRRCEGPRALLPARAEARGRSSAARHNPRAGHSPPAPVGEQRTATTRAWHRQGGAGGNGRVVRPPRRPSEREGAIRSFHASLPPGASQRLINPALHTQQSHRRPSRRLPWSADCCPSTSRSGPSTEDGGGAYTALVALPIHSALSPPHPMPQTGMSKGSMAT